MIRPAEMKLIQIVVNNICENDCSNCSQMVGHICKSRKYNMGLEQVENALRSLEDYPGHIGIFGGNPLLHPQFPEICKLLQKYVPVKARRELWCSKKNYEKHRSIIKETFYDELVAYNEHEEEQPCWHQPNMIAIKEVISDNVLRDKIIENCWVQLRWSAAITPMGAYFCEVASARANMLGGPEGLPVEPGWWKRPIEDFTYQKKALCHLCSMCLPMPMRANDSQEWDDISPGMKEVLKEVGSPRYKRGKCKVVDIEKLKKFLEGHTFEPETEYRKRGYFKDFPDWTPNVYRPFSEKKHSPDDVRRKRNE